MERPPVSSHASGFTLIEMLFVIVILSIGILAAVKMFPMASREQLKDRMRTAATYYAQDQIEALRAISINDQILIEGRHPSGAATESVGKSGAWKRYYEVTDMTDPLPNLKRVTVTVFWKAGTVNDTLTATTYLGR
jgi:prepilin-type N-terminal cleavage/methylation domain-containing protein